MPDKHGPQPGDAVVMYDPFSERVRLGVIDSSKAYPNELLMVVCGASAFRPRSNPQHVSCSGGPCPGLQADDLTLVGKREQRFWDWGGNLPGAGKGVDYTQTVNLWALNGTI